MNTTLNLLAQFESEITTSNRLPFAQIINPPNLPLAKIKKFASPYGWFIPQEQAELADFKAIDNFEPTQITFGEDTLSPKTVDGFLTKKLRISILHRSNIEVQQRSSNGWRYLGLGYQYGNPTKHAELAFTDRENYRLRTRFLFMFLDDNNQLLHQVPFKIGMNAGVGAAFGEEIKLFRRKIEEVFFKSIGKPVKALTDKAHALTVLQMEIGLHKGEGKAPFICPVLVVSPTIEENSTKNLITRRDRKLTLVSQPISSLVIDKASEAGALIEQLWAEHEDFVDLYGNDEEDKVEQQPTLEEEPIAELEEQEIVF